MNIGIDANEANVKNRVGSNVYAYQILDYLNSQAKTNKDLNFQIYLKNSWQTLLPEKLPNWQYQIFGPPKLWTQFALPAKLYQQKLSAKAPQLFFTPGHYAPRFSPIPTVVSIMDLAFLKFENEFLKKDLAKLKKWTKYSAQNAKHIFTISQASKNDIIQNYQISADKITVTYLGCDIKEIKKQSDRSYQLMSRHFGIEKPYFIFVGTLQPRKNISRLISSFSQFSSQFQLVIVGKKGWLYDNIYAQVKKLNLKNKVIFTGFVSEYEKIQLLKNAHTFILPSLYEGFGLPLLETMKLGIPAISSQVSSLPEVGGDAVTYIANPESEADIEKALAKMVQLSESKRLQIIANQKKQATQFSWQNCGAQTLEKLLNLCQN